MHRMYFQRTAIPLKKGKKKSTIQEKAEQISGNNHLALCDLFIFLFQIKILNQIIFRLLCGRLHDLGQVSSLHLCALHFMRGFKRIQCNHIKLYQVISFCCITNSTKLYKFGFFWKIKTLKMLYYVWTVGKENKTSCQNICPIDRVQICFVCIFTRILWGVFFPLLVFGIML